LGRLRSQRQHSGVLGDRSDRVVRLGPSHRRARIVTHGFRQAYFGQLFHTGRRLCRRKHGSPMILLRLFIAFLNVSFAAAPIEGVLDMHTAIEKGLAFSPDVQKASSAVNQAEAGYRLAEAKIFPNLEAQGLTKTNRNTTTYLPVTGSTQINGLYQDVYTA